METEIRTGSVLHYMIDDERYGGIGWCLADVTLDDGVRLLTIEDGFTWTTAVPADNDGVRVWSIL